MRKTIKPDGIDALIQSVYELCRVMRKKMLCCEDGEVHMGRIHALLHIQENPRITMKQLADALKVSSPSATSFVERLVKLSLVERLHDKDNRRFVRLKLLPKGKKILKQKIAERRKMFVEVLGALSSNDQKVLFKILQKVLQQ
jgi:MarR family transcriptional regulator, organic hydroperoxide resistance regulator